jgi:hypothetical protein
LKALQETEGKIAPLKAKGFLAPFSIYEARLTDADVAARLQAREPRGD